MMVLAVITLIVVSLTCLVGLLVTLASDDAGAAAMWLIHIPSTVLAIVALSLLIGRL